jgi:hypothetical protein
VCTKQNKIQGLALMKFITNFIHITKRNQLQGNVLLHQHFQASFFFYLSGLWKSQRSLFLRWCTYEAHSALMVSSGDIKAKTLKPWWDPFNDKMLPLYLLSLVKDGKLHIEKSRSYTYAIWYSPVSYPYDVKYIYHETPKSLSDGWPFKQCEHQNMIFSY